MPLYCGVGVGFNPFPSKRAHVIIGLAVCPILHIWSVLSSKAQIGAIP